MVRTKENAVKRIGYCMFVFVEDQWRREGGQGGQLPPGAGGEGVPVEGGKNFWSNFTGLQGNYYVNLYQFRGCPVPGAIC